MANIMLNIRIQEYTYTYVHSLYGTDTSKPHSLCCYVGIHNI